MQKVFVVDKNRDPLMPCHPARARELLRKGRAKVFRRYPFTIILLDREGGETQDIQFKVDPGSKTSGMALVGDFKRGLRCIWAGELTHRGQQIRDSLLKRRQLRRGRRHRKTRYRQPRFLNRRKGKGWLPPSLMSCINNITGDIVKAVVTKGTKIGTYDGRVAVRTSGSFNIKTKTETAQGISYRYCTALHRGNGYAYTVASATD